MFAQPAAARRHLHTRTVTFTGYLRDDGLWDIEAELKDTKSEASAGYERGELAPGDPVHHMGVRVTVDNDLVIRDADFAMPGIPFAHCGGAAANPHALVGATLGRGWRQAVDAQMKGVLGCSHLRELLYGVATAAFQTVTAHRQAHMPGLGAPQGPGGIPFYLGQCRSWAFDSPVVARLYPEHYRPAGNRKAD